jgi:hypothetical protein
MKKNCPKISLLIKGKLKLTLFISLALKTSCKSIDIERKISGINDLKTITFSIVFLLLLSLLSPLRTAPLHPQLFPPTMT